MNSEQQKISLKERIGYSLGDTASNLFFQTFIYYMLLFYTDVFGLSAGGSAGSRIRGGHEMIIIDELQHKLTLKTYRLDN